MCLINCFRNYLCIAFIVLSCISISNTSVSKSASFTQNKTCNFLLNSGLIIDLSPLINSDQPMYTSTNSSLYIYHPCTDVPLKTENRTECQNYQLCYFESSTPSKTPLDFNDVISNRTKGKFTLLAHSNEEVFRENQRNHPEIVYKHALNGTIVTTLMRLECNEKIEKYKLTIDKTSPTYHELILNSKYLCVSEETHMSGGAVFFIIVLVFAALYFIGGVLVLKFIRGATGIEMIPNHEFWCKVPQMTKDGIAYLSSCGRNPPDSYEKI